jgi:hypothetical protein
MEIQTNKTILWRDAHLFATLIEVNEPHRTILNVINVEPEAMWNIV